MTREAVHAILQGIHDRLEARKELAIAKVAPNELPARGGGGAFLYSTGARRGIVLRRYWPLR